MINILLSKINEEGIWLKGEANPDFLEVYDEFYFHSISPVKYNLFLYKARGDIIVKGALKVDLRCRCGKCLSLFNISIVQDELYMFYEKFNEYELDLTEDIREAILINFPAIFKCSEDCKGICFICGCNLNIKECSCKLEKNKDKKNLWKELDNLNLK